MERLMYEESLNNLLSSAEGRDDGWGWQHRSIKTREAWKGEQGAITLPHKATTRMKGGLKQRQDQWW